MDGLRERLAAGNAAYSQLMDVHARLRAAFDAQTVQVKTVSSFVQDWDLLCLRLYQGSRGRNLPAGDRAVLQRWSTWRASSVEVSR